MKKTITYVFAFVLLVSFGSLDAWAQGQIVKGRVTDQRGTPLPGATVLLVGSSGGTVTNVDGYYSVAIGDAEALIFSYLGFEQETVTIGSKSVIDVSLVENLSSLSEVVVVGYGSQEKGKVTGAITAVDAKAIEALPVQSFDQAIQGLISGVTVQASSGAPGAAVSLKIRGQNSVNLSSQPLYVVDGMIISSGDDAGLASGANQGGINVMSTLGTLDIESVTIMKDVASAAIFGARAGNGVVYITTKQGNPNETKVNFNTYYGVQSLRKGIDMADGDTYRAYQKAAGRSFASLDNNVNTNWQDELFVGGTDASIQAQDISVSGGKDNVTYFVSANHYKNDGIVLNTGLERFGIRANTKVRLDRFTLGNNMYVSSTTTDRMANQDATPLEFSLTMPSNIEVYDPNSIGGFAGPDGDDGDQVLNPIGIQTLNEVSNDRIRLLGNMFASYEIMDGLVGKVNFGYDLINGASRYFSPFWQSGSSQNQLRLQDYTANDKNWLTDVTLDYAKTVGEHGFGVLGGFSAQKSIYTTLGVNSVPSVESTPVTSAAAEISGVLGGTSVNAIASFFGRVNYSFRDKYIVQVVVRRDGISKFNPEYRWGTFPAASVAWRLGDEDFMASISAISDLKIRASYGIGGNAGVGNYEVQNALNSNARYVLGNDFVVGTTLQGSRTAQNLQWETVKEFDLGFELGLFDNKLVINADYYDKTTENLLLRGAVPKTAGFNSFFSNVGSMTNNGVDLSANYRTRVGAVDFSFYGNVSFINNEIITLSDGNDIASASWGGINLGNRVLQREGEQAGSFFGLIFDGIQQTDILDPNDPSKILVAAGTPKFKDVSGPEGIPDGKIDGNDNVILGSPIPDAVYGFGINAVYKGFDFALSFNGTAGNEIYSTPKFNQLGFFRTYNVGAQAGEAWTPENGSNTIQKAGVRDQNISSRWVEDGSFLRMKNIQLGYTFDKGAFGGVFSRMRVYVSGNNLFVISGYNEWGFDPEVGAGGIDGIAYPQAKSFVAGLNVSF